MDFLDLGVKKRECLKKTNSTLFSVFLLQYIHLVCSLLLVQRGGSLLQGPQPGGFRAKKRQIPTRTHLWKQFLYKIESEEGEAELLFRVKSRSHNYQICPSFLGCLPLLRGDDNGKGWLSVREQEGVSTDLRELSHENMVSFTQGAV